MVLSELLQSIHNLNSSELFYREYYNAKKSDENTFNAFMKSLDIDDCLKKHYIIPEIKQTIPPLMEDDFFLNPQDHGMMVQKHNCYTPPFDHFHNYFEIAYVFEGICTHEFFGGKQVLRTGDFLIIPPGTKHSISVQDQSIIFNIIISTEILENIFKNNIYYKDNILSKFFINNLNFKSDSNILIFKTGNDDEIKQLILKMALESINKLPESDAILNGAFSILFGLLLRYYVHNSYFYGINYKKQDLINKIIIYIQENYKYVNLQILADEFHFSKEYISKYIKENTNKSFSEFVSEARLKHAVQLLSSTSCTIADISFQIGYENIENFIRLFKKAYGVTPTRYRKNINEEKK